MGTSTSRRPGIDHGGRRIRRARGARRHSNATRLRLSVSYEETGASLVVSDDGKGFDVRHEGFGLRSMRERVGQLGGHVDVATAPGGTVLSLRVPW
jgi:signal transduction histidine kinase